MERDRNVDIGVEIEISVVIAREESVSVCVYCVFLVVSKGCLRSLSTRTGQRQ